MVLTRFLDAPAVLWVILSLPGLYWLYAYRQEAIFYGVLLHASGVLAARLLIIAMAVTPLGLIFPRAAWVRWLKSRRRYLGVAAFGYSLLHAAVYIQRRQELALIVEDARTMALWTGWLALLIMLVLVATSNDASTRLLKRGWKKLHRVTYIAALLTFTHWLLTAFNPAQGFIHLGILAMLEFLRLWKTKVRLPRG